MTSLAARLSTEQVERFQRNGFVFPLHAISADTAMQYRRALEKYLAHMEALIRAVRE